MPPFKLRHREVITTSKQLSDRLANLARAIRDRIRGALAIETKSGPLTKLMKAFQTALIHDLDEAGFADMYAQTITYGLLSARITDPTRRTTDDLVAHVRTNPFLKELLETFRHVGGRRGKAGSPGIDFDELGVSEVVEMLDQANIEAVVRDFGDQNPQEDPVIHFYEHFLAAYDKKQKVSRGVFYTPRPVVSYIVRSVDELLRMEFGLADGLADTTTWGDMAKRHKKLKIPEGTSPAQAFVQILDPATGTGTFLVEVIDLIHGTMVEKWRAQGHGEKKIQALWNDHVPKDLLPRLHGYELLMAPYAIAHLKIGLKLYETGYLFESDERAQVYLTNALQPPGDGQLMLDFLPALAHEAKAVNEIKRKHRFTVVIGNPPYSGLFFEHGPWIDGLLKGRLPDGAAAASYYHVDGEPLGERKVWLQDDYVKFIRLSQWLLDSTGAGVHGYISNHGYLDNPTFRGMRWSLMQSFQRIRVLDLHGNLKKKEVPPGGGRDVNVFDIQQGVAIGLFTKAAAASRCVCHADLWGEREQKYRWLWEHGSADTELVQLELGPPFHLFEPFDDAGTGAYYGWPAISEVMAVNVTGIVTARDGFVIDFDREALRGRIADLRSKSLSDDAIRKKYFVGKGSKKYPPGDSRGWKLPAARRKIREDHQWDKRYAPVLYRPFDVREMYYVPWMVDWPRTEVMPHMLVGKNLSIGLTRTVEVGAGFSHIFASRAMIQHHTVSLKEVNYQIPLYLYPGVGKADGSLFSRWAKGKDGRTPNLDSGFVEQIAAATELRFVSDGRGDLREAFGAEDVFTYIYTVFHSAGYRGRHEAHLKLDFPRVPLPGSVDLFRKLAEAGHDLLALHLLESPKLGKPITCYTGPRNPEVGRVGWSDGTVWLDAGKTNASEGHRATQGDPMLRGTGHPMIESLGCRYAASGIARRAAIAGNASGLLAGRSRGAVGASGRTDQMGRADGSASLPGVQAVCRARAALRGRMARPLDSAGRLAGRSAQVCAPRSLDWMARQEDVQAPASDREQHPVPGAGRARGICESRLLHAECAAAPAQRRLAGAVRTSAAGGGELRRPGTVHRHHVRGGELELRGQQQGLCAQQRSLHRPARQAQAAVRARVARRRARDPAAAWRVGRLLAGAGAGGGRQRS